MKRFFLLCAMILTGCATKSTITPPVVPPPQIPQPPIVSEPPPSGFYWQKHCNLMLSVRDRLKITLMASDPCLPLGHQK